MACLPLTRFFARTTAPTIRPWLLWLPLAAACPADKSNVTGATDTSSGSSATGSTDTTGTTGGASSGTSTDVEPSGTSTDVEPSGTSTGGVPGNTSTGVESSSTSTGVEPGSTTNDGDTTLDLCDIPEPCPQTWFGCDTDVCPNTNKAERVCVFTLLRDAVYSRFYADGFGEGGALTWVPLGDGSRDILVTRGDGDPIRRCELKPAGYFQNCIDTADDPTHSCNFMTEWVTAGNPWKDCTILAPFVCPEAP